MRIPNAWRVILVLISTILMHSKDMSKSVINLQLKRGRKKKKKKEMSRKDTLGLGREAVAETSFSFEAVFVFMTS